MDEQKMTQIQLKDTSPTGISSRAEGANIDGLAFNITFIASRNPMLAVELLKLYEKAHVIKQDDSPHPDEDFATALDNLPNPFKN